MAANPQLPSADDLACELNAIVGPGGVIRDLSERVFYSTDLLQSGEPCQLVVRPATPEELAQAVGVATSRDFAVMPRGGGLTYVGGYAPPHNRTVVVDTSRLDRVEMVSAEDMYVTVQAGVTWAQIYQALKPHGLRLPFFGTFSGRLATVGAGLSNGALFFGTARYGSAADIVLGMDVVLPDGSLLRTGQGALEQSAKPFYRSYGPDLTGLFTHDSGALGIKVRATLRVIRAPSHTSFASFTFASAGDAIGALSEIGRAEIAEEAYVMDPQKTRDAMANSRTLYEDVLTLRKIMQQEPGLRRAAFAGIKLALAGRRGISGYSLHLACAARNEASLVADLSKARTIAARYQGKEISPTIPAAARAELFGSLNGVLTPSGARWVALNAKVAHSDAPALVAAADRMFARHRGAMETAGVHVASLLTIMSNNGFSYEPVFTWEDTWLPSHRRIADVEFLEKLTEPPANPAGFELVMQLRQEAIDLFASFGAASSQIGRTYPYLAALCPETRAFVTALKRMVDPKGLMNPGVLGL